MVDQAVEIQPGISVRVVDVDEDKDTARLHGIVQSERTIVPAIYRADTDRVLFGIEDLETRLIELLEETP